MTRITVRDASGTVPYTVRGADGGVSESAMPRAVMGEALRRKVWEHDELLGLYRCGEMEVGEEHVTEEADDGR